MFLSIDELRACLLGDFPIPMLVSGHILSNPSIIRKLIVFLTERNIVAAQCKSAVISNDFLSLRQFFSVILNAA